MDRLAARRPLKTRDRSSARALAAWLARRGFAPNQISIAGVACAAAGAGCFVALLHTGDGVRIALLLAGAALVQLRLLANLLDGMVAIEGGRRSHTGVLFNEIPDRLADVLLLAGAGYAISWISWGDALGWAAATAAVLTAYVRVLAGSLGLTQHFCGPMAKPHRMALLTIACLVSVVEVLFDYEGRVLAVALGLVAAGSVVTFARRTLLLVRELSAR